MTRLLALFLLMLGPLLGADLDGTWKGTAETSVGPLTRTFTFHTDGTKFTGETVSDMVGKSEITNGKINGSQVSFDVVIEYNGEKMNLHYEGQLKGAELKLSVDVAALGGKIEYVAKKTS